ncbi:MAG: glutathione peroxidase [Kiritimatiellia bacterium]
MAEDKPASPLTGSLPSIDGTPVDLAGYQGKVVLVVNVASRCGYTKQYAQLQELQAKYEGRGLVVLGFPCNQFGGQEPGTAAEIKSFCTSKYHVTFPLFGKVDVNGEKAAPLFAALTSAQAAVADKGPVRWNFEKFLIGRDGQPVSRFRSKVAPDDPSLVAAIEAALGKQ